MIDNRTQDEIDHDQRIYRLATVLEEKDKIELSEKIRNNIETWWS